MRKPRLHILVVITLVFVSFTLGFFLGRNQNHNAISVSVPAQMMTIPTETTAATQPLVETTVPVVFPIDINTAEKEEFMALPGIGEVLAQRIIVYREEHGVFEAVEGLMNVEGIGKKRMDEILDLITIGG